MSINLAELSFTKNEWGQLVASLPDGTEYRGLEPVRCFPLSDPDGAIALVDAEGHELLQISDLNSLTSTARESLQRELSERQFMPVIQRIHSTSPSNPPCRWDVETDRGRTGFQLESEDDVRRIGPLRVIIADSNGIRYQISSIDQLDAHSLRIIRRLVG